MSQDLNQNSITSGKSILIVGCGRVGNGLCVELMKLKDGIIPQIYVADTIKERAIKIAESNPESITRIKWKNAQDTPSEVDLIILCVDGDSEKKLVDRIVLSKKNFITLSDDNSICELYSKYQDTYIENGVTAILGAGLFPGMGNAIAKHMATSFNQVDEVVIERLGFVSNSSLSSIKKARKEQPLGLRKTRFSDSKRENAKAYSWFVPPYNLIETVAVATGVVQLVKQFDGIRNVSVRYSEPKLPTFRERVRHLVLGEELALKNACLKVQMTGKIDKEVQSYVLSVKGDALDLVCLTALEVLIEFLNSTKHEKGIVLCSDYIEPKILFTKLYNRGVKFYDFNRS